MPSRHRGFTLVEVLVALSIMAVLAALAWRGIDGIVRTRDVSQAQMERVQRLDTVIAQWEQDLLSIFDTAAVPALAFDGATVRLVRTAAGGVQLVAWSLRGTQWQRWTGPVVTREAELQESWMRSQQLQGDESGQVQLLDNVTDVQLYFFRSTDNDWSNAQSSGDTAQPAAPRAAATARELLPAGVRLVLTIGAQRLTRDIVLAPQWP
jgi:general secretion pathway protein J